MTRLLALLPLVALTACADFSMPDFRGGGASAPATDLPATQTAVVAPAPVMQATAKERLVAALEGQGCRLNTDTVAAVVTTAGISQPELVQLIPELQAEGRAEVAGDGEIRLISPNCL